MQNPTTNFFIGSINVAGPWFRAVGEGMTSCAIDEDSGAISRGAEFAKIENAIWIKKTHSHLVVAHERFMEDGEISVYQLDQGRIGSIVSQPQKSAGGAICHVELTPDGNTLYAVSYLGGVSVHAFSSAGILEKAHQVINYAGSGPNKERQEKSHPHQATVTPDGKNLFVCDLGCDKIWIHAIEANKLGEPHSISLAPGSGPRHLVFHPHLPLFYLVGELDGIVRCYENIRENEWRQIATHPATPLGFTGIPGGAAIKLHPSGKSLAVSVRGSDNIAVRQIDANGGLSLADNFPTLGKNPRDFAFSPSGRWLLALNQDSDNVVPFEFDPTTGLPTKKIGAIFALGSPVCAVF